LMARDGGSRAACRAFRAPRRGRYPARSVPATSSPWPTGRRRASDWRLGWPRSCRMFRWWGEEAAEKNPALVDLIARPGDACWNRRSARRAPTISLPAEIALAMIICPGAGHVGPWAGWILNVAARPDGNCPQRGRGVTPGRDNRLGGRKPERPPNGYVGFNVLKEFDRQLDLQQRGTPRSRVAGELLGRRVSRDPVRSGRLQSL